MNSRPIRLRTFDGHSGLRSLAVAAVAVLVVAACDDEPDDGPRPADEPERAGAEAPADFDEWFRDVDCATDPETGTDDDGRSIRGIVAVVAGPAGDDEPAGPEPLERLITDGETPLPGATVSLGRVDERAAPSEAPLIETTADERGRWCFELPEELEFGGPWMVWTRTDSIRLRRAVVDDEPVAVDAGSEAMVRLLVDEGHRISELAVEDLEGLDERARSVLRDVRPRPDAGTAPAVDRYREILEDDPELMEQLDGLFEETGEQ